MSQIIIDHRRLNIRLALWPEDAAAIQEIRRQVFIVEQNVPTELEWDHQDSRCEHALATYEGKVVATGRLLPDGHIGRMAVLKDWRGQHIGSTVLKFLITHGRSKGLPYIVLSSQVHAIEFYRRHGFTQEGLQYLEAGIPHQDMRKLL